MYCFSKDFELRYTDVDFNDNLKLSSLLSVMEEAACLSADELGFGYSVLQPRNIGFILVNWHIELSRPVKLGEILTVNTWPIKPKKMIVFRDFEFFVGGEKVGVASSRWCLVDLSSFEMIASCLVFSPDATYNERRSVEVSSWKIEAVGEGEHVVSRVIGCSDYDHYDHVNNTKYADFYMDAFSVEELKGRSFGSVTVYYAKQTKEGETLDVYRRKLEDGSWVVECRVGGELHGQMRVTFIK